MLYTYEKLRAQLRAERFFDFSQKYTNSDITHIIKSLDRIIFNEAVKKDRLAPIPEESLSPIPSGKN